MRGTGGHKPPLFALQLVHAALQAVSEDSGILKVRGHAATVTFQFCHTPSGLLQLGLQCRHLHPHKRTHTQTLIITFRRLISHQRCGARHSVLSHLGIELLSALPLRLQFFLRLLESSADKFNLRLAALQLHGQLTVCVWRGGGDFTRSDGQSHLKTW